MAGTSVAKLQSASHLEDLLSAHVADVLGSPVGRDEEINKHFNINKLLVLIRNIFEDLGIELNVNSFYHWKTLAELSGAIENGDHTNVPKLLKLRGGDAENPLIIYAGGVSCFLEIKSIIDNITHDGAIYGMCMTDFGLPGSSPATIAHEVEASFSALRKHGFDKSVSLLGYSFGGLLALEVARKLHENGQDIRFLGLIDTPQSEHTWPLPVWLGMKWKRIRRKLGKLRSSPRPRSSSTPAVDARQSVPVAKSLLRKLKLFVFRFVNPKAAIYPELAPEWCFDHTPDYLASGRQLLRMKGLYRPKRYDGPLVFYRASSASLHDCDPRLIWSDYLPNAEWVDVRGNHLSSIVGRNGQAIGEDISKRLSSSGRQELVA